MPEITALGWFHTVLGIVALASGVLSFAQFKQIAWSHRPGLIYLLATLVTAVTALGIYNQGGIGVAHILAIMTLGGVAVGSLAEKAQLFQLIKNFKKSILTIISIR